MSMCGQGCPVLLVNMWRVPLEELLSLLGSGLVGVGEDELEEALGRARSSGGGGEGESGSGRDSRVALYEFGDPLVSMVS